MLTIFSGASFTVSVTYQPHLNFQCTVTVVNASKVRTDYEEVDNSGETRKEGNKHQSMTPRKKDEGREGRGELRSHL